MLLRFIAIYASFFLLCIVNLYLKEWKGRLTFLCRRRKPVIIVYEKKNDFFAFPEKNGFARDYKDLYPTCISFDKGLVTIKNMDVGFFFFFQEKKLR